MIILNTQIKKLLNKLAKDLTAEYKNKLKKDGSFSSGNLYNSIKFNMKFWETSYQIVFEAQDYWEVVEKGRRAGAKQPPLNKILEFIRFKRIIPRKDAKGRLPTQKQLAFLIARSISKKGIKPKKSLEYSVNLILDRYSEKLKKALGADYEINIGIMLDEELGTSRKVQVIKKTKVD